MDELKAITLFVRASDAGSFQRAASELGVSPQAVSKGVAQLERHLGVRLFHRTTRQNSLTAEGLAFLEQVRPGLSSLQSALAGTRQAKDEVAGPLRVTAAPSARKVLHRHLADFSQQHPAVQIDMLMSNPYTDLVAAQVDVGFRSGAAPSMQVVSRQLFVVQQIICAAPAYLQRHGRPRNLAELQGHRCTGFRSSETGRLLPWEVMVGGELQRLNIAPVFCADDPECELDAVLAGCGIGLIDSINAAAEIRLGRLVPLLPEHRSEHMGFHLYYPQRTHMPRRVRRFIDFMAERLRDSREFVLDEPELRQAAQRRPARRGNAG